MQTLDEQLEELYKQVEEPVEKTEPAKEEEPEEVTVDEPSEPAEVVQEQPKPDKNEQDLRAALANAEYAARQAAKREREALEQLENAKKKPVDEDPEPNAEEEPIAHLQWQVRQATKLAKDAYSEIDSYKQQQQQTLQEQQREQNFVLQEQQFAASVPDYSAVSAHMTNRMIESAKLLSPTATPQQIGQFVKGQLLTMADQYGVAGLYQIAKTNYGYQPPQPEKTNVVPMKPDLAVIEKSKQKSVNGLGGSSGRPATSAEDAAKMSIADLEKMDKAERMQLLGW